MRLFSKLLAFCCLPFFTLAQQGKIIQLPGQTKPGEPRQFTYTPPAGLQLPDEARIKVLYMPYLQKKAALEKEGESFGFTLTLPDTVGVFVAAVFDAKNKVVDNNGGKGYTVEVDFKGPVQSAAHMVAPLQLAWAGNFSLGLKNEVTDIIKGYESLYATHPELKEDESYFDYARLKNQEDPEDGRKVMLAFARENENKDNEQLMKFAMYAYMNLKMQEEADRQQQQILKKFPKGSVAKDVFMGRLYEMHPKTEEAILKLMEEYEAFFPDGKKDDKTPFYMQMIRLLIAKQEWGKLDTYEALLPEPLNVTGLYNNVAWEATGGDLTSPGKDLNDAEKLGARAVAIAENRLKNPRPADDMEDLQGTCNNLKDTYALVLYKLGRYHEAFTYQRYVDSLGGLDAGGKERMAAYAEKAKGAAYARTYIEKVLAEGTYSVVLLQQLERLYQQLNLPMDAYAAIQQRTDSIGKARAREVIISMYGSEQAIDFTLPDAGDNLVSLAAHRGKMVVLDFWATWCGPCLASFPKMQELVEKYDGKKASFLFINTWERDKPDEVKAKVDKLLKEKNYTFHVLYDFKDEVVKQYKIEGIPTKIVIDQDGKIVSINSSEDALAAMIEGTSGN